jgi:hypothetical protein
MRRSSACVRSSGNPAAAWRTSWSRAVAMSSLFAAPPEMRVSRPVSARISTIAPIRNW